MERVEAEVFGYDGTVPQRIGADSLDPTIPVTEIALATQAVLYGYDGTNLSRLLVESATDPNLRASLYVGANQIASGVLQTAAFAPGARGLVTISQIMGDGYYPFAQIGTDADNRPVMTVARVPVSAAFLYGFDGANFDRLRTYGTGILKVGRAEVGLTRTRVTATGQIGTAGAHDLYWLTIVNNSAANGYIAITDAQAAGASVVWDIAVLAGDSKHVVFDPPLEFATGIYLETVTNVTAVIAGYI